MSKATPYLMKKKKSSIPEFIKANLKRKPCPSTEWYNMYKLLIMLSDKTVNTEITRSDIIEYVAETLVGIMNNELKWPEKVEDIFFDQFMSDEI